MCLFSLTFDYNEIDRLYYIRYSQTIAANTAADAP